MSVWRRTGRWSQERPCDASCKTGQMCVLTTCLSNARHSQHSSGYRDYPLQYQLFQIAVVWRVQRHTGLTTIFNLWYSGALALRTVRQSTRMSKIKNDVLNQYGKMWSVTTITITTRSLTCHMSATSDESQGSAVKRFSKKTLFKAQYIWNNSV